jgi:molecular chaperone Hsp33
MSSPPGRIVSALACERRARVLVAVMHGPARELARRHHLGPGAARLASEGLVAAALLSSQLKGEERHTVNVYGEAPRFQLMVDLWAGGTLRARFEPADFAGTDRFRGLIAVLKFVDGRETWRGLADIHDETLEGALHRYYAASVQVDARVRILAELDDEELPAFAAGVLVERFPDMDPETFSGLFDQALTEDFRSLMTGFAFGQLGGQSVEVLDWQDVRYRCPCSRERVLNMLRLLGAAELQELLENQGAAEVTCHFCNEAYHVPAEELQAILRDLGQAGGEA